MKILCYTDNHFCERSSIITKYGTKYSLRLENQLASLNWAEQLAIDEGCAMIVCLGDFFDKPHLTDQEITAIQDIKWAEDIPHYFLVGNHISFERYIYLYGNALAVISCTLCRIDALTCDKIFQSSRCHGVSCGRYSHRPVLPWSVRG